MALSKIDVANMLTGTTPVANGGTGVTTAAALANTGNLVLLSSQTASNVGTVNFDNTVITSSYNNYLLIGHDVKPQTDNAEAYIAISVDNGSNFRSPGYSGRTYVRITNSAAGGDEQNTIGSPGYGQIASDLGNDGCGSFQVWFYGINEVTAGNNKFFNSTYTGKHGTDDYTWDSGIAFLTDTSNPINYIRFVFNSGNVVTGKFRLYGIKE